MDIEQTQVFQGFKLSTNSMNEPVMPCIKIPCSSNALQFDTELSFFAVRVMEIA